MVMTSLFVFCPVMGKGLGISEDVEFKSDYDQTTQRYILRLPVNFNTCKSHDLLIVLHGHGSDRWQFAEVNWPQCVAPRDVAGDRNMIFVAPDYRATTSWMGPAAEADVVQIIKDFKVRYKIDRVFLCGGSMGGSSALTFAVLHPDMIAGVAAMNPTANHLEYECFQDAIARSFGGTKRDIPCEYKKRSAEYWPEKINFPVGISVGGKDMTVPPESAVRLANVLQKIGKDVCLVNRPEMGHDTSYEDTRQMLEFVIDKANKGNSSTSSTTAPATGAKEDAKCLKNV
jgi:pimeloyl-ACP methyl ester carboxylesterase